jgi:chromate reductase
MRRGAIANEDTNAYSRYRWQPAARGASTGLIGTARAQNHLRQILVYLNMFPINQPEVLISSAMDRFDQDGNLTHLPTREHIVRLLQSLGDWVLRIGQND